MVFSPNFNKGQKILIACLSSLVNSPTHDLTTYKENKSVAEVTFVAFPFSFILLSITSVAVPNSVKTFVVSIPSPTNNGCKVRNFCMCGISIS